MRRRARIGVVLSGGGSRGAYEAGVVLYLRERLPKLLGHHADLDIVTGTSVGAINASYLAATMDHPDRQARDLCDSWRSSRIEELISLKAHDLARAIPLLLGRDPPPPEPGSFRYGGLLDTRGMERFVIRNCPWQGIRRNLKAGLFHAIAVSATHVGTGHTVVFTETRERPPAEWSRDPHVRHRVASIGPRHALASAAIPLLFPAVKIGRGFYVDGGLRQNTPMSPAIRLGADRLLVISLRHVPDAAEQARHNEEHEVAYPKPLFLAGKALNALMLDHIDYDLDRMTRLNHVLAAGEAAFGPTFSDVINAELVKVRGAPIRPLVARHVRPSIDIGKLAAEHVERGKMLVKGRIARTLIERMARGESRRENDLLSYLLFDGGFAATLIDLGYSDAAAVEPQLAELFSRDVTVEDAGGAAAPAAAT